MKTVHKYQCSASTFHKDKSDICLLLISAFILHVPLLPLLIVLEGGNVLPALGELSLLYALRHIPVRKVVLGIDPAGTWSNKDTR